VAKRPFLPIVTLFLADKGTALLDRVGTQWSQVGRSVRQTDHCVRARILFSVERSGLGHIKTTRGRVFGVVEPEADVESVSWGQTRRWIEAKDLVQQNRVDRDLGLAASVRLHICLVPGQAEILKVRVRLTIRKKVGVLDGE